MKYLAGFMGLLFCVAMHSQDISSTLLDDPNAFFCKPGVVNKSPGKGLLIDYRLQPDYNYKSENNSSEVAKNERLNMKLKIPFVVKPGLKMLLGFQYMVEDYTFDDSEATVNYPLFKRLNESDLKTARVALYVSKPLNHKFYTSFRLGVSYSGDYDKFAQLDNRYATYRGAAVFGYKKSSNVEYGIGIMYSKSFRRTNILPFGFYNKTFNEKWGVEFAIPVSLKARYNINDRNMLLFGPEFNSRSYSIDVEKDESTIFHYRRAAIENSVTYMHNIKSWAWFQVRAGYVNHLRSRVDDKGINDTFHVKPTNGFFGSVGIFLSPPKKMKY